MIPKIKIIITYHYDYLKLQQFLHRLIIFKHNKAKGHFVLSSSVNSDVNNLSVF